MPKPDVLTQHRLYHSMPLVFKSKCRALVALAECFRRHIRRRDFDSESKRRQMETFSQRSHLNGLIFFAYASPRVASKSVPYFDNRVFVFRPGRGAAFLCGAGERVTPAGGLEASRLSFWCLPSVRGALEMPIFPWLWPPLTLRFVRLV